MMFGVKYCKDFKPKLSLDGKIIKFVDSVKYLGVFLTDTLSDDCDITRQVKYLYAVGNSLRSKFQKCSIHIKNMSFRLIVVHCMLASCGVVIPMRAIDVFQCLTMIPTVVFMVFLVIAVSVNIK